MKYNCTMSNMGPLPIAYAVLTGKDEVVVNQLYKDKSFHFWCDYITGTNSHDFKFVGKVGETHIRVVVTPHPDINIKFDCEKPTSV